MMRRGTFFTFVSAAYDNSEVVRPGVLYRWDQSTPPAEMAGAVSTILAGGYKIIEMASGTDWFTNNSFTLILRSDFTLWAWSEAALSYYPYTTTPQQISFSAATSIMHISADSKACFAIDDAGRIWGWGDPFVMGVGGFVANSYDTPRLVSATGSFKSVNTRVSSALALRSDGFLIGWGSNSEKQLGHNGLGNTPDLVAGSISFVKFRVGGLGVPSVGISNMNGTLYAWGRNLESQCGITPSVSTVSVPAGIGESFADALGVTNAGIAIKAITGEVYTWGAGQTSYAPAWHSGTTHLLTNRSFATSLKSFARSTIVPYAIDAGHNIWGWNNVPVGTGANATSVPTQVSTSITFHDALLIGSYGQALT